MSASAFGAAIAGLLATAAVLTASAARAETWVVLSGGPGRDAFEVDVDSIAPTAEGARVWVQARYVQPKTDPASSKPFQTQTQELTIDCKGRRARPGTIILRDDSGALVRSSQVPGKDGTAADWFDPPPGSTFEQVQTIACKLVAPRADPPYMADIFAGKWTRIASSADGQFVFNVGLENALKLGGDDVLFFARTDDRLGAVIDGAPVAHVVSVYLLNCASHQAALVGADTYISGKVRIDSVRRKPEDVEPRAFPPESVLGKAAPQVCAAAVPAPKDEAKGSDGGGLQPIGSGTAWVTAKGYLVTASHVVREGARFFIVRDGEPLGEAFVVADDPGSDLAILKVKLRRAGVLTALPLAEHAPALGKSVFSLGYPEPQELGQQVKMTTGVVSGVRSEDDAHLLQVSAPLQPGNSGGPIIGWDGAVVGVADKGQTRFEDAPAQNVNYAVKASYVRAMLEDLPDLGGYVYVKPATGQEALVSAARRAVFMLIVTK